MNKQHEIKKIIQNNIGLITKLCNHFYQKNPKHLLDLEDYYQEAYTVITETMDQYDETKGKVSTFLYHTIKNRLSNLANQNNSSLSVTNEAVLLSTQIFSLQQKGFDNRHICKELNISLDRLRECENIINRATIGDSDKTIHPQYNIVHLFQDIDILLNSQEKQIMNYYLNGYTTKEIGVIMRKSPSIIRHQMRQILRKLKTKLNDNE